MKIMFACLLSYVFVLNIFAQAVGVMPLVGVKQYNGTYAGSFGTGIFGYSTLYRDNQDNGLTSGCRGDGCGRHPGVDIPVSSGTSVYSALNGQVVISRCDPTWGGLIVIKARNPYTLDEPINIIYGHLSNRVTQNGSSIVAGMYVNAGDKIGNSGGRSGIDPCSGRSTGAHLHFQIDKNIGSYEPYFPNLNSLNYSDQNYEVSSRTYNPIVFLQGGYKWSFGEINNRELWDIFNFQSFGVSGDALWLDGSQDPYIQHGGFTNCGLSVKCSSGLSIEASQAKYLTMDMYNRCVSGLGKIYFTTNQEPFFDEIKTLSYIVVSTGALQPKIYTLNHYKWRGLITGLRIDPAENCSPAFDPNYFGEIKLSWQ